MRRTLTFDGMTETDSPVPDCVKAEDEPEPDVEVDPTPYEQPLVPKTHSPFTSPPPPQPASNNSAIATINHVCIVSPVSVRELRDRAVAGGNAWGGGSFGHVRRQGDKQIRGGLRH